MNISDLKLSRLPDFYPNMTEEIEEQIKELADKLDYNVLILEQAFQNTSLWDFEAAEREVEDNFRGKSTSLEYLIDENFLESCGDVPEIYKNHFDYASFIHDLICEGYTIYEDGDYFYLWGNN